MKRVLIVGASAAGVAAARTLRREGFDGAVQLVDADFYAPYERPPLSKDGFRANACRPVPLLTPEEVRSLQLDLETGQRVDELVPRERAAILVGGRALHADAILLALGGYAARLKLPGAELAGIHVLRDFDDLLSLRQQLDKTATIAIVGGGLIGAELTATLLDLGKHVHWIDTAEQPLVHLLPAVIADHLVANHVARGAQLHTQARLRGFLGKNGHVTGLEFDDDEKLAVDLVIIGVGMVPEADMARSAGLATGDGIHVDATQATSIAGIYAAGDVASVLQVSGARRRQQHWTAAEAQGANAARAMLGFPPPPPPVEWFWSDQGPHHVEMAGSMTGDVVQRGELPIVFAMNAARVTGVASIDASSAVRIGMRLIASGCEVDRSALADSSVELRSLLRS
jgi:3-phenylpropionate/trans-cinnamate dioxygenase ferredoxin reductase subunit